MPDTFAKSPEGVLYIANGVDPVVRWDGLTTAVENAGVDISDATAVELAGSGVGDIFGSIYGYCRFVDRLGRISNMTPVASAAYEAKGIEQTITNASNEAPIVITSANHSLQTGQQIVIENVNGNTAANGFWTVTNIDIDTFSLDGSAANNDYTSGGTWHRGVSTITYSNLPTTDDPKIVSRQIYRTKTGDPNTVYLDIETETLDVTTFDSTNDDDSLTSGLALTTTGGDDLLLSRHGVPPADKAVFVHHIDRMFAVGEVEYKAGNIAVTKDGTTVTGIGTEWSAEFVDRYLYVAGGRKFYKITAVDLAAQTLTIEEAYEGSTELYAAYAIRPLSTQRRTLRWSEASLPESWNPVRELSLQENLQSGNLVGAMSIDTWLYVLAEARIYRFSYQNDPLRDGFIFPDVRRGAINQRCWVQVEDAAYLMDRQGIYAYYGNSHQEVSQPIQDMFERSPQGAYKINWNASHWFHAAHDPVFETVKFFVALGGDYMPFHAVCYSYRYRRLWVEEYPVPIGATAVGKLDGRDQLFLGSDHSRVLASGIGTLDGPDGGAGTVRGTVTSAGWTWLADTAASFGTDLVNAPVVITAGTGKGQRRRIVSVSGTTINVREPWRIQPDTTSVYSVGGIEYALHTGNYRWLQRDSLQNRRMEMFFDPTLSPSDMYINVYHDNAGTPETSGVARTSAQGDGVETAKDSADYIVDTTKTTGHVDISLSDRRGREVEGSRYAAFRVAGTGSKDAVRILQIGLYGMRR